MKRLLVLLLFALATAAQESPAKAYFSDVKLVDQDGTTVDLYALIKGRTVVMNSFFATCTGSCPVMSGTFALFQKEFPDRVGKDLVLISITVDPETDTPPKLKAYAEKMRAGPGWYLLTGSRQQVELALHKIGQSAPDREAHTNIFIVGNDRTGLWKKAFGLAKPAELAKLVEGVLNDGAGMETGASK